MNVSALVVAHNEEKQLAECLAQLKFAGEIVVVLDKCTDRSREIALQFGAKILEGDWDIEGHRRNAGIAACSNDWIFEIDADERATEDLGNEIVQIVRSTKADYHLIYVDNFIGRRLVRYGWGGSFGKSAYVGVFRKGCKIWGNDRVHPSLTLSGKRGVFLQNRLQHYVDANISETLRRLDRYSNLRAMDLRDQLNNGQSIGSLPGQIRRFFSRFFKCYVIRKGWREGGYGLLLACCAGLYPVLSYLKAKEYL